MCNKVKIWDLPTRIFHWSLVTLVAIGLTTGFVSPEWWMGVHIWAGYGTVLLVVFRLVWGIFGSEYSRIETFAFTPKEVFAHLRELIFRRPLHFIGHNPAGAMMIFALIFFLAGITLSGLLVLGGEENQGPLAGAVNYQVGDMAAGIHIALSYILIALIVSHITGVIVEIHLTGEDLIRPMIDGYKIIPPGVALPKVRRARPMMAAAFLLAFTILAGSVLWAFSTMPPSGIIQLAVNEDYTTECGACHEVYHPSLLAKASWALVMTHLDDHFGEDASLDQEITTGITTYLLTHAAEAWDTEASNRFIEGSLDGAYRITTSAYWTRKHKGIVDAVYARKGVGGKSHCAACHRDAASGYFADQEIDIPKE